MRYAITIAAALTSTMFMTATASASGDDRYPLTQDVRILGPHGYYAPDVKIHRGKYKKHSRSYKVRKISPTHQDAPMKNGLVTVSTAAGIPITVASHLAHKFQGFIADLVARGYKPRHIGSYANCCHVRGSRHYSGAAIDVDQYGWGKTAKPMYHVADLAAKWGLRDGCSFRHSDCGHIDDGVSLGRRVARHRHSRYASR